ncbi:hypothetical protein DPMN_166761 [Dreissena polymorpha]|uniref:Uncharacterized protein n=1 Tax=Dreissena polymorpha TaxID=45954 RepID=A0A9D4IVR7_DREPO|nr:hypothetical protein DPMN_166761 [Dreissena polymorpha]
MDSLSVKYSSVGGLHPHFNRPSLILSHPIDCKTPTSVTYPLVGGLPLAPSKNFAIRPVQHKLGVCRSTENKQYNTYLATQAFTSLAFKDMLKH